ncbi:LytR/AlgR family response regulator transcription factor [Microbulbifer sp. 2201CG32-9]|uniref:LytR/AlgR family response regulator transcription factor n=1 Tax=Microbulbifer sp. 2201CG32-9 TaxID=3232309 RepID=UPI00345B87D7
MKPLRVVAVDDEPLALRLIKSMLQELPYMEVLATCRNGREAVSAIAECAPDLVFLDIQMPGMGGFDVVRALQADTMPLVIFTTAYDQFALEAFEVNAVDYVLKPLEVDRLQLAVDRARERLLAQGPGAGHGTPDSRAGTKASLLNSIVQVEGAEDSEGGGGDQQVLQDTAAAPRKLAIKDRSRIVMVNQADIEWIDAAGDYMCVHAGGETHVMRSTMKELQQQLCADTFKRVHRSTLVNLTFIDHIRVLSKGEYQLTLSSGSQIKVSRNYRQPIKEYLDEARGATLGPAHTN